MKAAPLALCVAATLVALTAAPAPAAKPVTHQVIDLSFDGFPVYCPDTGESWWVFPDTFHLEITAHQDGSGSTHLQLNEHINAWGLSLDTGEPVRYLLSDQFVANGINDYSTVNLFQRNRLVIRSSHGDQHFLMDSLLQILNGEVVRLQFSGCLFSDP